MTNIWLSFGKYLAIYDWNFYMLQILILRLELEWFTTVSWFCVVYKLCGKIWNYIKWDASFSSIFSPPQITQINWMFSEILSDVKFIRFILLSEYLHDNILLWASPKYVYYNKILYNIGEKSVFLCILANFCAFEAVLLFHSNIILCRQLKVKEETWTLLIWFHDLGLQNT